MGGKNINNASKDFGGISKSLIILSSFTKDHPRQSTSDIAAKLQMSTSTVSRHLNVLLDEGFLTRDETTGLYSLGYKILTMAGIILYNDPLYQFSLSMFPKLSVKYSANWHLGIPMQTSIFQMTTFPSEDVRDLIVPLGQTYPMYCSAMGRAILAFMPPAQANRILSKSNLIKYTPNTIAAPTDLSKELEKIKHRGYSIIEEEMVDSVSSIAAPIFDSQKKPIAAISMSVLAERFGDSNEKERLIKAVLRTAAQMSNTIGHCPW